MKSQSKKSARPQSGAENSAGWIQRAACGLIPIGVFLLAFVVFLPTLQNEFVNWDDEAILVHNVHFRGLGLNHLAWMFTTFHHSLYRPVTWMTWSVDYLIWGMNASGYHLTSLLFHCANGVVFYLLALRLLGYALQPPAAFSMGLRVAAAFSALLFSLHPLRVEAVAWASGRENVVSGFFFLLTLLFYLKAAESTKEQFRYRLWVVSTCFVFGLSLLSKASGMTLPFALLILDVYPLRRLGGDFKTWLRPEFRKVWYEKVPFLILGFGAGLLGWLAKFQAGAAVTWQDYGLIPRLAQSVYGLAFYLWKTAVPLGLSPLYEMPQNLALLPIVAAGITVSVITLGLVYLRQSYPAGLGSWLFYVIILAPVLGIAQSGPQIAADRYSYTPCLGWALLAGGGFFWLWYRWQCAALNTRLFSIAQTIAVSLLLSLSVLSWNQSQIWRDSGTLWGHALALGPASTVANYHMGIFLDRQEVFAEAARHYTQALNIKPDFQDARIRLADLLARQGQFEQAAQHYLLALERNPTDADLRVNFANSLAAQGEFEAAQKHYFEAIKIDSKNANAYYNLGNIYARHGQLEEAMQSYRTALKERPNHAEAHFTLANGLATTGNFEAALSHYRDAVKVKPDFAEAYHNLGRILAAQGQIDQAIDSFRRALKIQPNFAAARDSLRQALAEQGK